MEPRTPYAAGPAVKDIVAGKGGDLRVGLNLDIVTRNGAASGQVLDATCVPHSEEEAVPGGIGPINGENGQTRPGNGLSLLDDATPFTPTIDPKLTPQRRVAIDRGQELSERLEAFEDILESEVGDTTMTRARNLERVLGLRQIYLKFDGGNPTGTQKDRIAFAQVLDALRRGYDTISVASCGNYGAALALAASLAGIECVIHIPYSYHTRRIEEIKGYGARLERVPGDYENSVELSRTWCESRDAYDANPGGMNASIQLSAYGQIAYEIYDELRDAPAAVALPVSNGTTLAGVNRGFMSLVRRGKTSRRPRMVAGSAFRKNPIVQAWIKKSPSCVNLTPASIRETAVNEPLVNWFSFDGETALEALHTSDGWAANASDKTMLSYARMLREKEGLSVLPASTAGLIALINLHQVQGLPNDRYVVILTGRRQ